MDFVESTRKIFKEEVIPKYWEAVGKHVRFALSDNGKDTVYLWQFGKHRAYMWHYNQYQRYISPKRFLVKGKCPRNRRILRNLEILK